MSRYKIEKTPHMESGPHSPPKETFETILENLLNARAAEGYKLVNTVSSNNCWGFRVDYLIFEKEPKTA